MKPTHIAGASFLVSWMLLTAGCNTAGIGSDGTKVTFLTRECGEFIFQRRNVMEFLQTQKDQNPKAAELLALLSDHRNDSTIELSCDKYCPILFNGMLATDNDFIVRCKDCAGAVSFEDIKGMFADAGRKEIRYIDKRDHVLISIRREN